MITLDVVIAGIVGTSVMLIAMWALRRAFGRTLGASSDMVGALGALAKGSARSSRGLGYFLHYLAGISFTFVYAALLSLAPIGSLAGIILVTTFIGLVHGMVFGLLFVITVEEHHPTLKYRTIGLGDALAQVLGHGVFGLSVGLVLGEFWKNFLVSGPGGGLKGGRFAEFAGSAPAWLVLFGAPLLIAFAAVVFWGRANRPEPPEVLHEPEAPRAPVKRAG